MASERRRWGGWSPAAGEVVTAPGEVHATDRGQVSSGWGEKAVSELDVSDQVVVLRDTGGSARLV